MYFRSCLWGSKVTILIINREFRICFEFFIFLILIKSILLVKDHGFVASPYFSHGKNGCCAEA